MSARSRVFAERLPRRSPRASRLVGAPWSDSFIVFLAATGFIGARIVPPVPGGPTLIAAGAVGVGWMAIARRGPVRLAIVVLVAVSTSVLAARSIAGLHPPAIGRWSGTATLLSDPQWQAGGVAFTARVEGKRMLAVARGPTAASVARRSAGETVHVTGTLMSLTAPVPGWMLARHLSGRLQLVAVGVPLGSSLLWRVANMIRRAVLRSAAVLGRDRRALFAGFVLGDAREQTPEIADDFRAAGLTHLLVVSGQNVAFTLAAAEPITARLRRGWRLLATLAVIGLFAAITRFEPSVLRASVMAAVVVVTRHVGRPQSGLRVLGLAVLALLLIDPLLAHSLGFGLSVGACAGISLLDRPIRAALPGPDWLRRPLATTLSAQIGTVALLAPLTGGFVLASVPANLLALPVAEPVMVWGVAAGLPAGIIGRRASVIAHLPTNIALWWVAGVARRIGRVPLGTLGGWPLVAALMLAAALIVRHRRRGAAVAVAQPRRTAFRTRVPSIALAALVVAPLVGSVRGQPLDGRDIARGARMWTTGRVGPSRRAEVLQLEFGADAARVLAALRRAHVDAIDLVVVRTGGRPQARTVGSIAHRVSVGSVMVGDRSYAGSVRPVVVATEGTVAVVGAFRVDVDRSDHGRLSVRVSRPTRAPSRSVVASMRAPPRRGASPADPPAR